MAHPVGIIVLSLKLDQSPLSDRDRKLSVVLNLFAKRPSSLLTVNYHNRSSGDLPGLMSTDTLHSTPILKSSNTVNTLPHPDAVIRKTVGTPWQLENLQQHKVHREKFNITDRVSSSHTS